MDKEFNERYLDTGIFTYTDDGFDLDRSDDVADRTDHIKWTGIRAMFAYKIDRYVVDDISLDVFCDNNESFHVTEESPGWYQFLENIAAQFPSIDKDWHIEIAAPAFETKLTLIYEREGRTLDETKGIYYLENR